MTAENNLEIIHSVLMYVVDPGAEFGGRCFFDAQYLFAAEMEGRGSLTWSNGRGKNVTYFPYDVIKMSYVLGPL